MMSIQVQVFSKLQVCNHRTRLIMRAFYEKINDSLRLTESLAK